MDKALFLNIFTGPRGPLVSLDAAEIDNLIKVSPLRYARFQPIAAVLNAIITSPLFAVIDPQMTGIIALNGPHQLDIASDFAETLVDKGWKQTNPIQFPFTLQSSIPCELSAYHHFLGPALSIGHNYEAIHDSLQMAMSYIKAGLLDHMLILSSGLIEAYYNKAAQHNKRHASILNFLVGNIALPGAISISSESLIAWNETTIANVSQAYEELNDINLEQINEGNHGLTPLVFAQMFYQTLKNTLAGFDFAEN